MKNPDGSCTLVVGEVYLVVDLPYKGFVVKVARVDKSTQGVTGAAKVLKTPDASWGNEWYDEEWAISALYVGSTYRLLAPEEVHIYLMSE